MTKCLIYARCSTSDQELESQLIQLREYASKQDWAVVDEVVDEWKHAKKLMAETSAPIKREVKRRMKK